MAMRLSRALPYVKKNMALRAKFFIEYLQEFYPHVKTWGDLKPSMLEGYIRHCEKGTLTEADKKRGCRKVKGLRMVGVKHRLEVVKAAWRLMRADYPELVPELPKTRLAMESKREIECLDAGEIIPLLDWPKSHDVSLCDHGFKPWVPG